MLDGSSDPKQAAGVMLRAPSGRILFLKRSDKEENYAGHWGLPGGGGEDGEMPDETARREASEEIGHSPAGDMKLIDRIETPTGMQFSTFMCEVPDELTPVLNDEHDDYRWSHPSDAPEPLHPGVAKTIKDRMMRFAQDHFAFDKASIRRTDEDGHMHVALTPISKATVNPYMGKEIPEFERLGLDPDKIYNLLRDPKELEKAAPTFEGKPLLMDHTPVSADDHPKQVTVGSVGNGVVWKAPHLMAPLAVWDQSAIDGIEDGSQRELSSAYRYDADMTPGEYEGQKYDGRMTNIRGNHVALVHEGRAGKDVIVGDAALIKPVKRSMADMFAMDSPSGKFSEADTETANPSTKHRDDMPESAFLEPGTRKYPVKEKRAGDWKYDRDLLLAAARRARMQGNETLAARADAIRKREFGTANDMKPKESLMAKTLMTRKAALLQGALMANLAPKLAQDAKLNLGPILKGVTAKNFATKRDGIIAGITKATAGKLAQDADIEDLADLLDAFKDVEPAEDEDMPKAAVDAEPDDKSAKMKAFLADKLSEDDMAAFDAMMDEEDAPAMDADETEEERKAREADKAKDEEPKEKEKMIDQKAMDSAIKSAVDKVRRDAREVEVAREAVRPYVGKLSIACDTAAEVYKAALTSMKVDVTDVHPSAFGAILRNLPLPGKTTAEPVVAMDAKAAEDFANLFPDARRLAH